MRKVVGAAVAVALVGSGAALAASGGQPATTKPVMATFTAAPSPKSNTKTCTGGDGTYHVTQGNYIGTITSADDPRLNGTIQIRARSVVNTSTGYGFTVGRVHLQNKLTGAHGDADVRAVNTHNGVLNGFLLGHVNGRGPHNSAELLANFTAAFNGPGTSLTGQLGGDRATPSPNNPAVLFSGHLSCKAH